MRFDAEKSRSIGTGKKTSGFIVGTVQPFTLRLEPFRLLVLKQSQQQVDKMSTQLLCPS